MWGRCEPLPTEEICGDVRIHRAQITFRLCSWDMTWDGLCVFQEMSLAQSAEKLLDVLLWCDVETLLNMNTRRVGRVGHVRHVGRVGLCLD